MAARKFTWQELAELNEERNAHVAVRGKVYDLRTFFRRHPGGVDQMRLAAGRDVTQLFEMYHDFSVSKVLDQFYVGELVTNELPVYPEPGEFAKTLKKRVKDHFKQIGVNPKDGRWTLLRYALFLIAMFSLWYLQIFVYRDHLIGCITVTSLFAVVSTLATMNAAHDCSHFAVTNKPWVWRLLGAWHDFINGISEYVWIHQHTLGHHPYTNVDHADPDIVTAANELPDLRRIKDTQTWLPRYFYQHLYMPLLYGLLAVKTRIQEFYILFIFKKNGTVRVNKLSAMQWFLFFGGKIFYYTYRIVIPLLAGMPVWQLLSLTVLCDMFTSYYLALVFQVSHVNSNVEWPLPDENKVVHADWWKLQILTTQDYSTDSWFVTFMTGALNHQTAHHVFPGVAQCYLPIVTPIVKKTCEEFGVKYNYCGTFWDAISSHVGHLKRLGYIDKSELSSQEVSVVKEKTY